MNKHYKSNERELVKVATFFKKQSRKLIDAGKLGEEHRKVEDAVDRFVAQMDEHANARATLLEQRELLKKLVKDNAVCPKCNTKDKLKIVGTEKDEKGRKSNRYKCRKCNIEFTWNMPNNPWDMIDYIEEVLQHMRLRNEAESAKPEEKEQNLLAIESLEGNLVKLKPVIEDHNLKYNELQQREEEMDQLIHEFKNTLLIEKIKMDTWENKTKHS
jgi:hypothetical protein